MTRHPAVPADCETFVAFARSEEPVPSAWPGELRALALWARGDWDGAHRVVQDLDSPTAAWIHAFLHRHEGDLSNARYWYRRAGRRPATTDHEAEWREIVAEVVPGPA